MYEKLKEVLNDSIVWAKGWSSIPSDVKWMIVGRVGAFRDIIEVTPNLSTDQLVELRKLSNELAEFAM